MGVGGIILGAIILKKGGCCGVDTIEEKPDPNYRFLENKNKKKDGLDIYEPQYLISSLRDIRCPLCKFNLPVEEQKSFLNQLNNYGESKLITLINEYNNLIKSSNEIELSDIINDLDTQYKKIEEFCKHIEEENKYYKHSCKRFNGQKIYIKLYAYDYDTKYDNYLKLDIKKFKTDDNYKNNILNERKKDYEEKIKAIKKEQIEQKYRTEFDNYTFQKEAYLYQNDTSFFEYTYESDKSLKQGDFGYNSNFSTKDPFDYFINYANKYQYSSSKKKLLQYIENVMGKKTNSMNAYSMISMTNSEYEEFQDFIIEREPEYKLLL